MIVGWVVESLKNGRGKYFLQRITHVVKHCYWKKRISLGIVSASARVKQVAFGALDYTADIGTSYTKSGKEILYARTRLVVASRAVAKEGLIDTVFPNEKILKVLNRKQPG